MKTIFKPLSLLLLIFVLAISCTNHTESQLETAEATFTGHELKADSVLKLMTLQEKIGQLNQYNGFWDVTGPTPQNGDAKGKYDDIRNGLVGSMLNVNSVENVLATQKIAVENTRLHIPLIFGYDVIHGYKTMMPIPLAESCSWNLDLMEQSAKIAAAEAAASGINWTFAPMVDIGRDARWGRVMEGAGEDPYLGAKAAAARVKGFQGDLGNDFTVAACAKHFAGYGFAEAGREYNTTEIGENTLRNIILPPFKAAAEAGVATFMNGFHEISGTPVTGDPYLQREILKGEWDYKGMIVSDWGSINELYKHGMAEDSMQAAEFAIIAGSDMDMEGHCYINFLEQLVKDGKVKETLIDDAARRVLALKFQLGLFDDPYKYCNAEREAETIGKPEYIEAATQAARESIVLLKNENNFLPLSKEQSIIVIGPLAADKDSPLGSWRAKVESNSAVSVVEGIENILGTDVNYIQGCKLLNKEHSFIFEVDINTTDKTGIAEAVSAAKGKDAVVMVLGEDCFQSGEGRSRTEIGLPGVQLELLKAVQKVNPNIVLVAMNGRPLTLSWEDENIPAIVEAWHLGTGSGTAIADVLFGNFNPSGKLTMSFPRNVGQCPIYYNIKNTGRATQNPHDADMVFYSHYSDSKSDALYPFGYGLSYSTFEYGDITLSANEIKANGSVTVSTTVTNTSDVDGEEISQLYIKDVAARKTRPVKELKGFKKTKIAAGETANVSFELTEAELSYYCNGAQIVEPGVFKVFVGSSSTEVQETSFTVVK